MRHFKTDTIALKKLMIDCGLTSNTALAEASGVDRNTVGKIVSGKAQPSADVMDKLAQALNMEPATAGAVFFAPNLLNA